MRPTGDPGPPVIMGVVNVTPDSFSDGGRWLDPAAAVAHGLDLVAEGATVIDVGGESTRPYATPIDPVEEQRRVLPVISGLAPHVRVAIDTRNSDTAAAAIDAGATLVNDVSASLSQVAADAGVGWVVVHMQGDPRTMQVEPRYDDVVIDVRDFLVERADEAVAMGVDEVWIDPGFGFGKTLAHNLAVLGRLDALVATGFPVAVGLSRKWFLGRLTAASDARAAAPPLPGLEAPLEGPDAPLAVPVDDRLEASVATAAWAMSRGARMVRVHDVAPTARAAELLEASWSAA
jgi:dihydropteroate synthase